jgi:hypothetical protein
VKAEATKRAITMTTRVASNDDGNGDGGKSDGDGDEGAGRATTRAMAAATTVAAMRVASLPENAGIWCTKAHGITATKVRQFTNAGVL